MRIAKLTALLLLPVFLFPCYVAASNATDYFRSAATGNWTSTASWQSATGAAGPWVAATLVPTQTANTITIQAGHVISISTARTFDQLVIKSSGTLQLTGGSVTLNNGTGYDMTIEFGGKFIILTSQNYSASFFPGTSAMSIEGSIEIGNNTTNAGTGYEALASNLNNAWEYGAKYVHNSNSAVVTGTNVTFFGSGAEANVLEIRRLSGTLGNSGSLTVNGYVNIYTNVTVDGAGTKLFRDGFYGNNTLTFASTSGTINVGNATPDATSISGSLRFVLYKNVNILYSLLMYSVDPTGDFIVVDNASTAKFVISAGRTVTLDGGTSLDLGTQAVITNNGTFDNGGTLRTANANGLTGSTTASISGGTVQNQTYSYVEYYGGTQSVTTMTYGNLTIMGSGTKTAGTFNLATDGTLYITGSATLNATGNIGPTATNSTDLTMDGTSRFILRTAGTQPNMQGTYALSGSSVVEFANNNTTAQAIRNGSSYAYQNIDISGNNVGNASTNIYLKGSGIFKVTATGIFSNNSNSIQAQAATSGQSVTMLAGGVFKVFNAAGFNGTTATAIHSTITSFNLDAASTVEYARNGDQTITNANSLQYGNLTLSGTSGIKTAPSGTLILKGNFSRPSANSFLHNSGTVSFSGTQPVRDYNSASGITEFYKISIANSLQLRINHDMGIANELLLSGTSATLQVGANIIMRSSSSYTARVAELQGTNQVTYTGAGAFTIERYLPGHRAWRLLATPVDISTSPSIFNSWQEDGSVVSTGYGLKIAGPQGTTAGFDFVSALPTMKYYNKLTNTYTPVTNTTTPIANNNGYFVFVLGDRAQGTASPGLPTNLRIKGKIRTGTQPSVTVPALGCETLANPYPSQISFASVAKTNIVDAFITWNPSLPGNYNVGGYETWIRNGVNYKNAAGTVTRNFIESGETVFVQSVTGGSFSISENAKNAGSNTVSRLENDEPVLRLVLYNKAIDSTEYIATATCVNFESSYSNEVDNNDVRKFTNRVENIGIRKDSFLLEAERRNLPHVRDTIFLELTNTVQRAYRLLISANNLVFPGLCAFLIDKFTNTDVPLNLEGDMNYTFGVNADSASFAANRFCIVFRQAPFAFVQLVAERKAGKVVALKWNVINEETVQQYEIENSEDGISYRKIGLINAQTMLGGSGYEWMNSNAFSKKHFYRVWARLANGMEQLSNIAIIDDAANEAVQIVSNPVLHNMLRFNTFLSLGKYEAILFDEKGSKIFSATIVQDLYRNNHVLTIPACATGYYVLLITGTSGKKYTRSVLVR
ncbi:MAG: hypothetical protein QM737_23635 [Ferruginibacter sp.]